MLRVATVVAVVAVADVGAGLVTVHRLLVVDGCCCGCWWSPVVGCWLC